MHPRTLSILPLLVLAALLGACAHGGSGLFGVVSGAGSTPPFTTADLAGAWTGVLTPVPPTNGPANGATDPYPFYVRFDAAGMPTEGADGRGWDWDLAITSNNAAVNKQGDLLVEISGNGAVNVLKLFGTLSADKQVQTGTYTISKHLNVIEEGNYVLTRSSGPGHFSIADQVAGSWTGIGYRKSTNRFRDLLLDVDASGSVIGGELVGEHVFIQNGVNTGLFDFLGGDDEVGRLDNVVIQSTDGSTQTLHYLLFTEDGTLAGGPGTDSVLGSGIVRIVKSGGGGN